MRCGRSVAIDSHSEHMHVDTSGSQVEQTDNHTNIQTEDMTDNKGRMRGYSRVVSSAEAEGKGIAAVKDAAGPMVGRFEAEVRKGKNKPGDRYAK